MGNRNDEGPPSGPDRGDTSGDPPDTGHATGQSQPTSQNQPGGQEAPQPSSGGQRTQGPASGEPPGGPAGSPGGPPGGSGGGGGDPDGGSRFGGVPVAAVVVIGLVALAGVGAAQFFVLGGGDTAGADSSDAVEQVPAGVDSISRVDTSVLEDNVIARLYAEAYNTTVGEITAEDGFGPGGEGEVPEDDGFGPDGPMGPGVGMPAAGLTEIPETLAAFREAVANETGVDPTAVEEAVVFQKQPSLEQRETIERQPETAFEAPYAGMILHTEWDTDRMVGIVENNSERSLERTTVSGTTVYRPADTGGDEGLEFETSTTGWLAVLGDGEYAVGTPEVVNDTIAVANGEADPVGGDLLAAYERTSDGFVRQAQRSQNVNVTRFEEVSEETGLNFTAYAEAYNDLHVSASSTYTTDDGVGSETVILTNSTDTAKDVASMIEGFRSIQAGAIQNETVEETLRSAEITRDGTTVRVTQETSVETVVTILDWYVSLLEAGSTGAAGTTTTNPVA